MKKYLIALLLLFPVFVCADFRTDNLNLSKSIRKPINATAHGFTVGQILRLEHASYVLAQADTSSNAEVVGIVSAVIDANNFMLTVQGWVSGLSGLLAGGGHLMFLSSSTAGALTETETNVVGTVSKPLFIPDSSTSGYFYNFRGMIISSSNANNFILNQNTLQSGSTFYVNQGDIAGNLNINADAGEVIVSFPDNSSFAGLSLLDAQDGLGASFQMEGSVYAGNATGITELIAPNPFNLWANLHNDISIDQFDNATFNSTVGTVTIVNNLNVSTATFDKINITSNSFITTLTADQYGILVSSGLTIGTTGFGPLVATNAGVQAPLLVISTNNAATGFQMVNESNGASANIQFILADNTRKHYLGLQEPSTGATGTLFGVTKSAGDFFLTNTLAGGTARTMVVGTVGNEDQVFGTNNTERARFKGTGSLIFKAGSTAAGSAPIRFTSGSEETSNETGIMQFSGNNYSLVDNSNVKHFIAMTSTNATLATNGIVLGQGTNGGWLTQKNGLKYDDTNSSTNGGLYLPAIPLPIPTPTNINPGAIHYNSWIHELIGLLGGDGTGPTSDNSAVWDILAGTIFTSSITSTVSNTSAESTFTVIGFGFPDVNNNIVNFSNTLPNFYWAPGRTLEVKAAGYYTTFNTNTIDFKVKIGTYTFGDTTAITSPTQVISSQTWVLNDMITCITTNTATGALGTFWAQGLVTLSSAPIAYTLPLKNNATISLDTRLSGGVNINVIEGTTSPAMSTTMTNFRIDRHN